MSPVDDAIKTLFREDRVKKRISRDILLFLNEECFKNSEGVIDCAEKKLKEIQSIFNLNNVERELLLLFHLVNSDCMVDRLRDSLSELMQVTGRIRASAHRTNGHLPFSPVAKSRTSTRRSPFLPRCFVRVFWTTT